MTKFIPLPFSLWTKKPEPKLHSDCGERTPIASPGNRTMIPCFPARSADSIPPTTSLYPG